MKAYDERKGTADKQANLVPTGLHIDGDRLSYVTVPKTAIVFKISLSLLFFRYRLKD